MGILDETYPLPEGMEGMLHGYKGMRAEISPTYSGGSKALVRIYLVPKDPSQGVVNPVDIQFHVEDQEQVIGDVRDYLQRPTFALQNILIEHAAMQTSRQNATR